MNSEDLRERPNGKIVTLAWGELAHEEEPRPGEVDGRRPPRRIANEGDVAPERPHAPRLAEAEPHHHLVFEGRARSEGCGRAKRPMEAIVAEPIPRSSFPEKSLPELPPGEDQPLVAQRGIEG